MKFGSRGDTLLAPPLPRASVCLLLPSLIEAIPEPSIMPAVVATIWVAIIIAPVIRPVVWVVVVPSSVVPTIRIAIVATISIAIATIPVAGISLIAITTPLRHIAIYAALRICRWSEGRRYREREDAH
jgi:hypothetical protein